MSEKINDWKNQLKSFIDLYNIPDDEELTLRQADSDGEVLFFVTYNKRYMDNEYYLYKIKDGKAKKIKKGESPDFKELGGKNHE